MLVGEMPSTSDSFLTSWQNWTLIRVGIVINWRNVQRPYLIFGRSCCLVCMDFDFFEKFSTVSQKENHKKGDDEVKDLPSEWVEHEYSTKKRLTV